MNFYYVTEHKSTKKVFSEIQARSVGELPIKHVSQNKQQGFISLVDKILISKEENPQAETNSLENEIDKKVYHLYSLTYDEVLIVDPNPPFTREEYEQQED